MITVKITTKILITQGGKNLAAIKWHTEKKIYCLIYANFFVWFLFITVWSYCKACENGDIFREALFVNIKFAMKYCDNYIFSGECDSFCDF